MKRPGRALGRGQELDRLLGQRLGLIGKAETPDELVARGVPAAAANPGSERRWCSSPSTAFASIAEPTWVMTCSVKLPSVAAKVFHSRWAAYIDLGEGDALDLGRGRVGGEQVGDLALERDRERVLLDRGLEAARWPAADRSSTTGSRSAVADARAIRTASPATRSASAVVRMWLAAKPHAPSTRTRTPKPSLSPEATPSTRPVLIATTLVESPDDTGVGVARAEG